MEKMMIKNIKLPNPRVLASFVFALVVFALTGENGWAGFPDQISSTVVFRQKDDGYNNVRIPAICVTKEGTLLAFAEGRVGGDAGKIELILKRSRDLGRSWSEPSIVWADGENTCGNPTPVVDRQSGRIWLFCTWNLGTDMESRILDGTSEEPRKVFLTFSDDDGTTWAEPVEQPHLRRSDWLWYATGPCHAIQLTRGPHAGRLVVPANHSVPTGSQQGTARYRSHLLYSDDHGTTWQIGAVHEPLTNESTVVELSDGSVMQNMRSYHGKGCRAVAISRDGGVSFEKPYLDESLSTPVCQANLLRYNFTRNDSDVGELILFSSPLGKERSDLSVWTSRDDGKTWPIRKRVFQGPSAYSDLIVLPDGQVGLLAEVGEKNPYETITFATFSLDWLLH